MADAYVGEIRLFAFNYPIQNWVPCDGRQMQIMTNQALFGAISFTYGGDGRTYFNLPDLRGRVPVGTGTGTNLPAVVFAQQFGQASTVLAPAQVPLASHTHAAVVVDPGHTHDATLPTHTHPVAVPCDTGAAGPTQSTPQGGYLSTTSNLLAGINTAIDQANVAAVATGNAAILDLTSVSLYAGAADGTMASFNSGAATATGSAATSAATTGVTVQLAAAAAPASAPLPLQPPSLGANYMICVNGLFPVRC